MVSSDLGLTLIDRYREDAGGSIQSDVRLLSIGYVLIIAYVAIMLGKFTRLNVKVQLEEYKLLCFQWYKVYF